MSCLNFKQSDIQELPFKHCAINEILNDGLEHAIHDWFEQTEDWGLTQMDFYTQFEFSLFDVKLPEELKCLISEATSAQIKSQFFKIFGFPNYDIVGITAHKLIGGHKIGVHNDFIGDEETHRLLIQINPDWQDENGGFLMLFNSQDSQNLNKMVRPLLNTGFAFEITDKSYHAVSTVYNYSRYTIVYTLRATK